MNTINTTDGHMGLLEGPEWSSATAGLYEKVANWVPFVVTDGMLVTGQNPVSSRGGEALTGLLASSEHAGVA
jgi:hypothetical protein